MSTVVHYYAALNLPLPVPGYVTGCRHIVTKCTNNVYIPSTTPALSLITQHVDALDDSQQLVRSKVKGAASDRDAKLVLVRADMRQLKSCIQSAADANIPLSRTIIESTGLCAIERILAPRPDIRAKHGLASTLVELYANAVKGRVSFMWQMSTDLKTWVDLPETLVVHATVTGLSPGTLYYFRYRTLTRAGLSAWSAPTSIIAH